MIVLQFNMDKSDLKTFGDMLKSVKEAFPEEVVIGMPDGMSIMKVDLEWLIKYRDYLSKYIERIENEVTT